MCGSIIYSEPKLSVTVPIKDSRSHFETGWRRSNGQQDQCCETSQSVKIFCFKIESFVPVFCDLRNCWIDDVVVVLQASGTARGIIVTSVARPPPSCAPSARTPSVLLTSQTTSLMWATAAWCVLIMTTSWTQSRQHWRIQHTSCQHQKTLTRCLSCLNLHRLVPRLCLTPQQWVTWNHCVALKGKRRHHHTPR